MKEMYERAYDSGLIPKNIPREPDVVYKEEYEGPDKDQYLPFGDARTVMRKLWPMIMNQASKEEGYGQQ